MLYSSSIKINPYAKAFLEFLPSKFSYSEAMRIGTAVFEISVKTSFNYLKELKRLKLLEQPKKNGLYYKS